MNILSDLNDIKNTEGAGWVLVYNENDLIMAIYNEEDSITSTKSDIEVFDTEEEMNARILELGFEIPIDPPEIDPLSIDPLLPEDLIP